MLSCPIDVQTNSVETIPGSTTYTMLLSLGTNNTCAFSCSITGGGKTITGVAAGGNNISMKNYYYFRFPGLTLGTPYNYTCTAPTKRRSLANANNKQSTATFSFIFPRNSGKGYTRVLAFGDWSDSWNTSDSGPAYGPLTLASLMANRSNYYDCFLFAGDMSYNLAQMETFTPAGQTYVPDNGLWGNQWMAKITPFLIQQPFFFTAGNHEAMEAGWGNMNRFYMPNYASAQNHYYSVDVGIVHAVTINSNLFSNYTYYPNAQNTTLQNIITKWLINDLNNSTQRWKVVFLHQPFYCSAAGANHCGPASAYIQALLEPILIAAKVDLVIQGHVHNYERFMPMNNGTADNSSLNATTSTFTNPKYPIYAACGAQGNNEGVGGPNVTPNPGSITSMGSNYGSAYCEFAATNASLYFDVIGTGGYGAGFRWDSFTIAKQ